MRKFIRALDLLRELVLYQIARLCGAVMACFFQGYRNVWMIAERGREAKDNGYHFFAWLTKMHPEINAWYVVDKRLPDAKRVQALGNTVHCGSWKHYMLFAVSKMKISTHIMGFTPDIEKYYMLDKINAVRGKKVFLQHGIIKEELEWLHYPNVKPDLFICSIPAETEFVKAQFGYPEGVIKCAGLCRFDALSAAKKPKRQILLMPTWRKYAVEGKSREEFTASEYYRRYQELITDPELGAILREKDYRMVFYPHYEVQKFLSEFHTEDERIEIGALEQYDVQQLLMESSILITDFSSVYFDFAYMEKPMIYYQFDEKEYHAGHYKKGYFDFERDGFGPVVADADTLKQKLIKMLEQDGKPEEQYLDRIRRFFPVRDNHNCERNYQEIIKLSGKK